MKLITKTADLDKACRTFSSHDYVAVDTEFLRDVTYWPRLCLIQMAAPGTDVALVDALAPDLDLKPFLDLMADETVTKVFHAARQDVEIIYHLGGLIPHPLFDTQVAAAVCGHGESVGYEALVREIVQGTIDKSHRFTDWSRRPLSDAQLAYAAADVIHLQPIYEALQAEVDKVERHEWIREEMDILTSPETYNTDPAEAWRRLKMKVRKPREFAAFKALAEWREKEAQTRDVPRSRVLKDDGLYEIAVHLPDSESSLARLRAVPKGYERSSAGREILKLVRQVKELPDKELPPIPRPNGPQRMSGPVSDLLKVLLKAVAAQNKVASRLVATSDDIEAIAADDDADVAALKGWRREIFGDKALDLKHGRLSLAVDGNRLSFDERDPPEKPAKSRKRRRRKPAGSETGQKADAG
ncbi:ribonuclease D [Microbaculum marinum]|uniref:Ribonuclease D n=1 Tax=Microbaculum marinum TaxID=1764581 RepID=A0AAW9RWS3_9HYPH